MTTKPSWKILYKNLLNVELTELEETFVQLPFKTIGLPYDFAVKVAAMQTIIYGGKTLVLSAAYRHTKEFINSIYELLAPSSIRQTSGGDLDKQWIHIGRYGELVGMPLGDGTVPRGFRPDRIIFVKPDSIDQEIHDLIVRGWAARTSEIIDPSRFKESGPIGILNVTSI